MLLFEVQDLNTELQFWNAPLLGNIFLCWYICVTFCYVFDTGMMDLSRGRGGECTVVMVLSECVAVHWPSIAVHYCMQCCQTWHCSAPLYAVLSDLASQYTVGSAVRPGITVHCRQCRQTWHHSTLQAVLSDLALQYSVGSAVRPGIAVHCRQCCQTWHRSTL